MNHSEYVLTCARCGKKWKVRKYIYRLEFMDLDIEEFRPWSRLGIDLCFQCNEQVKRFIFGDEKEMELIDEEKEQDDEEVDVL